MDEVSLAQQIQGHLREVSLLGLPIPDGRVALSFTACICMLPHKESFDPDLVSQALGWDDLAREGNTVRRWLKFSQRIARGDIQKAFERYRRFSACCYKVGCILACFDLAPDLVAKSTVLLAVEEWQARHQAYCHWAEFFERMNGLMQHHVRSARHIDGETARVISEIKHLLQSWDSATEIHVSFMGQSVILPAPPPGWPDTRLLAVARYLEERFISPYSLHLLRGIYQELAVTDDGQAINFGSTSHRTAG